MTITSKAEKLKAPFPYFGGKSRVADLVWSRFGNVRNYVEPFFGSGAVLLGRPDPVVGTETVNDMNGYISNFWRALRCDPKLVAEYADWPVNENDLHARHAWLVGQRDAIQPKLEGDPEWYDAKIAGWWVWGMACWIGRGFCSGDGPWNVIDGQLVHLGNAGQGVNRKRVHLGDAGQGVNRQRVHLSLGRGVNRQRQALSDYMISLSDRVKDVRVCCGDWSRVCGPTPTVKLGLTGVFLDPPYGADAERSDVYGHTEDFSVAGDVRKWAIENGDSPLMRIALCGYDGEHEMPESWECVAWKAHGGYGLQGDGRGRTNKHKERIWFSPNCSKNELF